MLNPKAHIRTMSQTGFTLVETLVAVLMLSVVMVAVTNLLTRSLQAISTSQDFFIASKLALEGMEMIRAKRNNNLIEMSTVGGSSVVWNTGMGNGSYQLDATDTSRLGPSSPLSPESEPIVLKRFCVGTASDTAGRYVYNCSDSTATKSLQGNFSRVITISDTTTYYTKVTVTVRWDSPRSPYVLSTMLYNAS